MSRLSFSLYLLLKLVGFIPSIYIQQPMDEMLPSGTLSPRIEKTSPFISFPTNQLRGRYTLYSVSTQLNITNVAQTTFDLAFVDNEGNVHRSEFLRLSEAL